MKQCWILYEQKEKNPPQKILFLISCPLPGKPITKTLYEARLTERVRTTRSQFSCSRQLRFVCLKIVLQTNNKDKTVLKLTQFLLIFLICCFQVCWNMCLLLYRWEELRPLNSSQQPATSRSSSNSVNNHSSWEAVQIAEKVVILPMTRQYLGWNFSCMYVNYEKAVQCAWSGHTVECSILGENISQFKLEARRSCVFSISKP
jgi:hypothetical protein